MYHSCLNIFGIGIRAFALGHRIKPLAATASAATIVIVEAGAEKEKDDALNMWRLKLISIMVIGSVLTKFDPKCVGYAYSYGYGYGYGYWLLGGLYSYGYSGASDDPKRLTKPTWN
jgi:hypothetical protein